MRLPIASTLAVSLVLAACGVGTATAGERTITVEMKEFAYTPATIALRPGERVTLTFKNAGTVEHEFMAGRAPMTGMGYGEDWLAMAKGTHGGGHDMGGGSGVRVDPKNSTSVTLVVPAEKGEFECGCFVAGHYEGGMKGRLVVE